MMKNFTKRAGEYIFPQKYGGLRKIATIAIMLSFSLLSPSVFGQFIDSIPQVCNGVTDGTEVITHMNVAPGVSGPGTLKIDYEGDLGSGGEIVEVYSENGTFLLTLNGSSTDCSVAPTEFITLPKDSISAWAADGMISFTYTAANATIAVNTICGPNFNSSFCITPVLSYPFSYGSNNAGVASIDSPSIFCAGNQNVVATIQNFGGNIINSVDVNWSVDGVMQPTLTYTSPLDSAGSGNSTAQVNLGAYNFVSGSYLVKVWTSNPNNTADTVNNNDTVLINLGPALSGTYSIGPAATDDYNTIASAVNDLMSYGVCGPVVFNVSANTYTEQVIMGEIAGASATNTITFSGAGAGNTVIQHTGSSTADWATIMLNGTDYVTFENMSVHALGTDYGIGIFLTNQATNNTFDSLHVMVDLNSTSSNVSGIIASASVTSTSSYGDNAENTLISNSTVQGGYYGIRFNGSSTSNLDAGNQIINNNLVDWYYYGIYGYYQDFMVINDNEVEHTRSNSFADGIYLNYTSNFNIEGNMVIVPDYGLYIYSANYDNPLQTATIINNSVRSEEDYGLYTYNATDINIYHNSFYAGGSGIAMYHSSPDSNIDVRNNILYSEDDYAFYTTVSAAISAFDHNVLFRDQPGNLVYWATALSTLADLQLACNCAANSIVADPVFANPVAGILVPVSAAVDNIGTPVGVLYDVEGNLRSTTTPDLGAFEFTGLSSDIAIIDARLATGQCPSANDSIYFTIENVVGGTINFATDPLTANWTVTGPVNSSGTIVVNTDTLAANTSIEIGDDGVNFTQPGTYVLNMYIMSNAANLSGYNDTLMASVTIDIPSLLSVTPQSDTVTLVSETVTLMATSPLMPGGNFFISEISHFKTSTGAPAGGWPSYLSADDYIEITGVPGSDLGGITLEQWSSTTLQSSYTFPSGTILSPNGTAIIQVGSGAGTNDPSNFYYDGRGTGTQTYSSSSSAGRILKDAGGNIIDAVGYNNYNFPAAANVPASEWSNPISGGTSTSGIRLIGPDNNTGSSWVVSSSTNPQDPNILNSGVTLPVPTSVSGFAWIHQGNVIDTVPQIKVGPYTTSGIYEYIALYNSPCGVFSDTTTIVVNLPSCPSPFALGATAVNSTSATLSWTTGGATNWNIEYGPAGFTLGTGTTVTATSSSHTVTGLSPNLVYEYYVQDSCGIGNVSTWVGPFNFTGAMVPCDDFDAYNTGLVGPQSILINEWAGAGGDAVISTDYASSGTQSLKIHNSGPSGYSDVVAEVGVHDTGKWVVATDFYIPATYGGYYNILHNYQGTGTNVWAIEVTLDANGTATVNRGTNGSGTIGTYTYIPGAWNTVEHIIDLTNDTAWIRINGNPTNVGWQFSLGSSNFGGQFNAFNFYSTAPTGQTPLMYFDNFCVTQYIPPANDVSVTAIVSPFGNCGDSTSVLTVQLNNSGSNPQSNIPVVVNYSGAASGTLTGTYTGTLQPNQSVNLTLGTINTYAVGTYNIVAFTQLTGDMDVSNDTASVNLNITSSNPDASINGPAVTCVDAAPFNMMPVNLGGTFTGVGIINASMGTFDPAVVGVGSTTVYYTITNALGCTKIDSLEVIVNASPVVDITSTINPLCSDAIPVVLTTTTTGGTWTGTGVDATGTFDPAVSGPGTFTIKYSETANGCTATDSITITVTTEIVASVDSIVPASNTSASDGKIFISVNGGTAPYTFNWSNGATSKDLTGLAVGAYTVTITDANGCESVETYNVTFGTGVKDIDLSNAVSVYPNPSNGALNVHIKNGIASVAVIEIYDVLGKQLIVRTVKTNGDHIENFDLGHLASGSYMVKIILNGEATTKKFLITD